MARGPGSAYERMLSVAVAALHEREPERLWPLLAAALPDVCGGETVIYKLDDWSESAGTVGVPAGATAEFDRLDDEAMGLMRSGYPFAGHYATGSGREPVTAHRAVGRALPGSATARLIGDIVDADHVLGIPLPGTADPITGCLVYRAGTDFTDDHLRMAQQVQPLLTAVEAQRQLLAHWRRLTPPGTAPGTPQERAADCSLTPSETAVLLLLTDALTAAAIGRRLGISSRTVHKHIENIYRKLGTRDRISTVLRAQQLGLVSKPPL